MNLVDDGNERLYIDFNKLDEEYNNYRNSIAKKYYCHDLWYSKNIDCEVKEIVNNAND